MKQLWKRIFGAGIPAEAAENAVRQVRLETAARPTNIERLWLY